MEKFTISKGDTTLTLKGKNLNYNVVKNGFEWVGQGRKPHIFFQKKIFGRNCWIPKRFSSAGKIEHVVENDKITSTYSDFRLFGKKLQGTYVVTAQIKDSGLIDFSIEGRNEEGTHLKTIYFPRPFNAKKYNKKESYTVDPMRQGFMLPDSPKMISFRVFSLNFIWRKVNTGDAYMPVWGRVCGKRGFAAIADESYDCSLFSCFGKGMALLTSANWQATMGKLGYKRTVSYHFFDECDYVKIAKTFRNHEIEKGRLVTIDEKIEKNPNVAKLIGSPVIHWRIMENNSPESKVYKKEKVGETLHYTFDQTSEMFRKFKAAGLEKAYLHLDGWGNHGYDNLHPYILPPCPKAGGYDGMKRLADTCHELGYQFGLHDQYRDFYFDSPVYDRDKAVVDITGKVPYCDIWSGGPHNWLCSSFAKEYVERTYRELKENGVNVDGAYLDVFGIAQGDECAHEKHPVTRKESIAYRGDCFNLLREQGIIVSSEELACQTVGYLDLVHHAPYQLDPQERGNALGIPIPLANLVYHDCVFVPWHTEGTGGWGIPNGDAGRLHCILNGQTPYFSDSMSAYKEEDEETLKKRIADVNEAAKVNELVYNSEMVSHKFLDGSLRKQQTKFANGYVITVDFDKNTFEVKKENA